MSFPSLLAQLSFLRVAPVLHLSLLACGVSTTTESSIYVLRPPMKLRGVSDLVFLKKAPRGLGRDTLAAAQRRDVFNQL